jgi:hypothetical protein
VGNATQRGERPGDSYFSPQANRTPDGAEMAGLQAGRDHTGNGIRRGEKAAPEQARGRAGTAGARTFSTEDRLPEFAWAPEMTQAANRAHPQTIQRGGKLSPPPSQWPAAGGALYGSRGSPTKRRVLCPVSERTLACALAACTSRSIHKFGHCSSYAASFMRTRI